MTLDELMPLFDEYQYQRRDLEDCIAESYSPHADPTPREREEKKLRKKVAEARDAFEAALIEYVSERLSKVRPQ